MEMEMEIWNELFYPILWLVIRRFVFCYSLGYANFHVNNARSSLVVHNRVCMAHALLRSFSWQNASHLQLRFLIKAAGSPSWQLILNLWSTWLSRLLLPFAPTLTYMWTCPSIVPLACPTVPPTWWPVCFALTNTPPTKDFAHRISIPDKPVVLLELAFSLLIKSITIYLPLPVRAPASLWAFPGPITASPTCTSARGYTRLHEIAIDLQSTYVSAVFFSAIPSLCQAPKFYTSAAVIRLDKKFILSDPQLLRLDSTIDNAVWSRCMWICLTYRHSSTVGPCGLYPVWILHNIFHTLCRRISSINLLSKTPHPIFFPGIYSRGRKIKMIHPFTNSAIFGLLCFLTFTGAGNVTYDFKIGWLTANPDGAKARPVIGINGQWPIPIITANVGDRVIVNVENDLGNQSTSLHFHGLYQNGTTDMDGSASVTQCPIPPGATFTYDFEVSFGCYASNVDEATLIYSRSNNLGRTGTTPTQLGSILMVSVELWLSQTQTVLTRANTMESSCLPCLTGITTRFPIFSNRSSAIPIRQVLNLFQMQHLWMTPKICKFQSSRERPTCFVLLIWRLLRRSISGSKGIPWASLKLMGFTLNLLRRNRYISLQHKDTAFS